MSISLKKLILIFILTFSVGHLLAQTNPDIKSKAKENDLIKDRPALVKGLQLNNITLDNSYLLIVDDRIFNGPDQRFKLIPRESIELVRRINDTLSRSIVKHILIYKTKAK